MPFRSPKNSAYLGLFLMTLIVGLSFMMVKIGLQYSDPIDLLAHRFSGGAVTIGVLAIFGIIKFSSLTWSKVKSMLLLSLFFPIFFFGFQTFGMQYSTASEAGIIFATLPIITLFFASLFLKEKTNNLQKVGIVLSLLGIAYIIFKTGNLPETTSLTGIIFLFLSVFSVVIYYALGKKISLEISVTEITVWMTLLAFLFFNGWNLMNHLQNHSLSNYFDALQHSEFLWSVLYLGILSSVVTSFLTVYALSKIPASQIAVFNNLSPIIAIVSGVVILNENLYSYQIIGAILVIVGVGMTLIFDQKSIHRK